MRNPLSALEPFREVASVTAIDFDELHALGVRGLIFDLENTLALYRAETLLDGHLELLVGLQARGFALGLVSNSPRTWVAGISEPLGIPFVANAGKPRRRAFEAVLQRMPVRPEDVVVIGDQLVTDVLGAQWMGMRGVLVHPLGPDEPLTSKIQRQVFPRLRRIRQRVQNSPRRRRMA
jgi:HAD superfamily phosphatase (TIGR01668 family)